MYVAIDGDKGTYDVAYEQTWREETSRLWQFGFPTEVQRTLFLRWAEKRVGVDPDDRADFLRHWDMLSRFDPAELRAFLAIKWRDGNSAAVRAIRQSEAGARESLQIFYALNAVLE